MADGSHPEDSCDRCGRPNPVWNVDSDRYNTAVNRSEIVCPSCFVQAHEQATGICTVWQLVPMVPFRWITDEARTTPFVQAVGLAEGDYVPTGVFNIAGDDLTRAASSEPPVIDGHTRASTGAGPDYCAECSAIWQQWVRWPCDKEHAPLCPALPGGYSMLLSCCRGARYHADAALYADDQRRNLNSAPCQ